MAWSTQKTYLMDNMNASTKKISLGTEIALLSAANAGGSLSNGKILVGNGSNLSAAVTPSGDATMTNAGVITVSKLNNKTCYTGLSVSETDGDATITISVPGLVAADVAICQVKTATNAVYVTKSVCGTDSIVATLSGNGGATTVLSYIAIKA